MSTFVRPGAQFDKVTEEQQQLTKNLTLKDYLLVIGGTNNIEHTGTRRLLDGIQKVIMDAKHTNLILPTVPMRHDNPKFDLKISRINAEIEKMAEKHPKLQLLPVHLFPRHSFTRHGLHLNRHGKLKITDLIEVMTTQRAKSSPTQRLKGNSKINIVNTGMNSVIKRHRTDTTVGFAHSISEDRHMSAGVAVVFRTNFGRPQLGDHISKHLACQSFTDGAKDYSLITKEKYFSKPTPEDYSTAFKKFQDHF